MRNSQQMRLTHICHLTLLLPRHARADLKLATGRNWNDGYKPQRCLQAFSFIRGGA